MSFDLHPYRIYTNHIRYTYTHVDIIYIVYWYILLYIYTWAYVCLHFSRSIILLVVQTSYHIWSIYMHPYTCIYSYIYNIYSILYCMWGHPVHPLHIQHTIHIIYIINNQYYHILIMYSYNMYNPPYPRWKTPPRHLLSHQPGIKRLLKCIHQPHPPFLD